MKAIACLIPIVFLVFCSDDFDRQLRGQWRMKTEVRDSLVYRVDTLFYCFDSNLCKIKNTRKGEVFAVYELYNDSLDIMFVRSGEVYRLLTNKNAYGWLSRSRTFRILEINENKLVLRDGYSVMTFSKF